MKKLLLVIDFQKDFISGTLGFSGAPELDAIICKKITAYREEGYDIAFTFDTHQENYLETLEGKHLPVVHCIEGTEGWELFGNTASCRNKEDICFKKETFGCNELGNWLSQRTYDVIELCGVVTNICVLSNAVIAKAAAPEADILIDANAVGGGDKSLCEKALDIMEGLQMKVMNR